MIKVKAIENFGFERYDELKNIVRFKRDDYKQIYKGDIFECDEKIAKYLLGDNPVSKAVVKVIEVKPDKE